MLIYLVKPTQCHYLLITLLCFLLHACTAPVIPDKQITNNFPADGVYLGAIFKDSETGKGLEIRRLLPGPMMNVIHSNDDFDYKKMILLSINQSEVNTKNISEILSQLNIGDTCQLYFRHKDNNETKQVLNVTLDSKDKWTGPANKLDKKFASTPVQQSNSVDARQKKILSFIRKQINAQNLEHAEQDLYDLFKVYELNHRGYHSLSRVIYPFHFPRELMVLEQEISSELPELEHKSGNIFNVIAKNLDLHDSDLKPCDTLSWRDFLHSFTLFDHFIDEAFIQFTADELLNLQLDFSYLLSELSDLRSPLEQQEALRSISAMNKSMQIDFNAMLEAGRELQCFIQAEFSLHAADENIDIPDAIKHAVKGRIIAADYFDDRWFVYGSTDDNRYDMSVIDVVFDPGGNDIYNYGYNTPKDLKLLIDASGNDHYHGDTLGPATGMLGISLLNDQAGNDTYHSEFTGNGVGLMGLGILIDHSGSDSYQSDYFSIAAGFYGSGILLDLGEGSDSFQSSSFSQGFGGPRGLGLLYNANGDDHYLANSQTPSAYGIANTYASFSQGIGYGVRPFDTGGIGILFDARGADSYEAGEFSQAGGYFWGLGILHDAEGDDEYQGNRYSQGFGVHQASGVLVDDSGDDYYTGVTAACQGAAWDIALGLLLDFAGDDHYSGDNLCQGSAAMQAMGWLIDLEGYDSYESTTTISQGHSGENHYHYKASMPVFSWSVLLDAGGQLDQYSNQNDNNQTQKNSTLDLKSPEKSKVYGLLIDTGIQFKFDD